MRESTDTGTNKTGASIHPDMSKQMEEGASRATGSAGPDSHALDAIRTSYYESAQPLGSEPGIASAKQAVKAGMEKLKGHEPTILVDKLGERLAFERSGTRLYEAILTKFDVDGTWEGGPNRDQLKDFRDEELKHYNMVCDAVEQLGGDPTVVTPMADVVGVTSEGIMKVITDPRTSLSESLSALLVAELADNDGWRMLIKLAESIGKDELASRFRTALAEEDEHLSAVRRWLENYGEQRIKSQTAPH